MSGFHEAARAAFAAWAQLTPGEKMHLQYTTTRLAMHEWLGFDDPYGEDRAALLGLQPEDDRAIC